MFGVLQTLGSGGEQSLAKCRVRTEKFRVIGSDFQLLDGTIESSDVPSTGGGAPGQGGAFLSPVGFRCSLWCPADVGCIYDGRRVEPRADVVAHLFGGRAVANNEHRFSPTGAVCMYPY